jgi:hypothetical protein
MGGIWNGLLVFLEDPNVELDNRTERAMRGVVLGRKSHYGSRSKRGTEVAALFYSLIESAKLAGVEPHAYLKTVTFAALRGDPIPLPHDSQDVDARGLTSERRGCPFRTIAGNSKQPSLPLKGNAGKPD